MQVKGKVNSVMMDACKKVGIVFESVVASFEAVNCSSLQIQCTGACPSLNIDKTDGAQARLDCFCQTHSSKQCKTLKTGHLIVSVAEVPIAAPLSVDFGMPTCDQARTCR
jgi:adenylyl cyclase-associated protein